MEITSSDRFPELDWGEARIAIGALALSKYCDFNLVNIVAENRAKHTFEVRILPAHLRPEPIIEAAILFEALLRWCSRAESQGVNSSKSLMALLQCLPLEASSARRWCDRAQALGVGGEAL
jgi:hypothetical protein